MKSKLTDLASQLAGCKRVRVLDYAPAEPQPTLGDRVMSCMDAIRDHPCLCTFSVGLIIVIAGSFVRQMQLSSSLVLGGVVICSVALQWWLRRPSRPSW